MDLQFLSIKLYADEPVQPGLVEFIPIFHSWIQQQATDELLIDVATYSHVPGGPGILLIGHEADYSVEYGPEEQFGMVYRTKRLQPQGPVDRLWHAMRRTAQAAARLAGHPSMNGRLDFPGTKWKITLNRRREAPNTTATFSTLRPLLKTVLDQLFGPDRYSLTMASTDPRERFAVMIKSQVAPQWSRSQPVVTSC